LSYGAAISRAVILVINKQTARPSSELRFETRSLHTGFMVD
jgi:hypothetical protein